LEAGAKGSPSRRPYHVTKPVSRVLYRSRGDGHSSGTRLAARLMQPTRAADLKADWSGLPLRAAPIRSCSRWGLPCRPCYQERGALLPHPFTLTLLRRGSGGRFAFCCTVPGVAPAGGYPAPCFHGARTFLSALIRNAGRAAIRPA